jgi:hypothetical protein
MPLFFIYLRAFIHSKIVVLKTLSKCFVSISAITWFLVLIERKQYLKRNTLSAMIKECWGRGLEGREGVGGAKLK